MTVRDWLSNVLNDIMNCKKVGKNETIARNYSKLVFEVLKIMESEDYIKKVEEVDDKFKKLSIKIGNLNKCKAIKPRFFVSNRGFEKYVRRYLPARDFGIIIVSTNKGLMTHKEAIEKKLGGSLIAYCY
ncbi:30S ribosomal protein S8 [Candidatus Pacearchaeota archaeon CG_4_9_14_3_um_filter_31_7]|nr:MAG: 30S ribosomal protein S8 [Candidatus Pacearchaeota archaeon CG1_02_31_27]PIN92372.1 MAG: 30S ribosomal protein S8 [Candidatus Pacearchaeota archaeon CG10_big_fil_rev_8_21_14_0_10_31_59]PIZ80674.1 MAG: 30S ribosomal protein S8 [Candidatus Pacearchaeota archaeon CG_4_10_14_0_2_um_filter_31_10]PJA70800.1 MAG: 30S ribosomal protein S8 [Candidatus Pacearchaeota archaeon CG_4_9_14_3_um_filter_31_7]